MKRKIALLALGLLFSVTVVAAVSMRGGDSPAPPAPEPRVSAPGRVESVSEEIDLCAEVPGRILEICGKEGDSVESGQILIVLSHADRKARVAAAEAEMENALAEWRRKSALHRTGDVSSEESDRAERTYKVALALLDEARDLLEKSFLRSPIRGTIVKKHRNVGEIVSPTPDMPILVVADLSSKRVRVDVDEADVGRIRVGQTAYITADAFGDRRFAGRVAWVGLSLGRKNLRTEKPTEKLDTKVLEVLLDLEDGRELPLNLRVDAFVDVN